MKNWIKIPNMVLKKSGLKQLEYNTPTKKTDLKGIDVSSKEKNYKEFFEQIKKFKDTQAKQKQRGLNDYNILTTVLKPHDEVRVHSRMIGSFLDIDGKHYQDDLFLKEFLKCLNIDNYNTTNSKVYNEYENIDLYLTDGVKHIIIENKIWAGDQKNQIKRYIETIKKENEDIDYEDLYVIYLSTDRAKPSSYSLGDYKIDREYIVNNNNEKLAIYKAMHYKTHILDWLEKCQYEVQNITNLNEAIKQYKSVVEMVTNNYKGKVMNLEGKLLENREWFKLAKEISQAYEKANQKRILDIKRNYLATIKDLLNNLSEKISYKELDDGIALDIISKYLIRIIPQEELCIIQITDVEKPFNVDRELKIKVLEQLKNINNNFKSGWNKVYGVLEIKYDNINEISNIMQKIERLTNDTI
jgi:hypothetical protein